MNDREFIEHINNFIKYLEGNEPTDPEIIEWFGNDLSDDQTEAIKTYVSERQIDASLSEAEREYLAAYESSFVRRDKSGEFYPEKMSFDELISFYQEDVVDISKDLHEKGLDIGDLISEGNLALVETATKIGSGDFEYTVSGEVKDLHTAIVSFIKESISNYIISTKELNDSDEKVVIQANLLNDTIARLHEENGIRPNIDELANELGITQQKVLDIIDLAGKDEGQDQE